MADKRNRAISGRLYKRDTKGRELPATSRKHGVFWLQYDVNGKRFRERLADPVTGEAVTERERAEEIRKSRMAPFTTKERIEKLKTLRAALADAEGQHVEALELARTKAPLADAWSRYLAAQNRPDTGKSTLKQYSFQWAAFARWLSVQYPDASALCQVAPAMAGEYTLHMQEEGLSPGTINKHVRLLKLVFRVLGRAEGMTANPFADIASKKVVQTNRLEFSWDVLSRICDAAEGEMKLLFFLGIYTGQRLGDCCLLAWDQVDLTRRPGWILLTPHKTASRSGKPLHLPVHPALRAMLETVPVRQRVGFVLPELAKEYQLSRTRVTRRIQELLLRCGVQIHRSGTGRQRDPKSGEEVHTGERAVLQYGFHSLRHTTVTLLQVAGVPQAVVQEIVGHRTVAMTQRYTHIGREALVKAVAQIPAAAPTREGREDSAGMPDADEQRDRERVRDLAGSLPVSAIRRMLASVDAPPDPA